MERGVTVDIMSDMLKQIADKVVEGNIDEVKSLTKQAVKLKVALN